MEYIYDLTRKDLRNLGVERIPKASRYFALQDGPMPKLEGVFARARRNGKMIDIPILHGTEMNEEQCKSITNKFNFRWS